MVTDEKEPKMVSVQRYEMVKKAIHVYDNMVSKKYLIGYTMSKKDPMNYLTILIEEKNFWHLLGCELRVENDSKKSAEEIANQKHQLYEDCKNGLDTTRKYLYYTGNHGNVDEKYDTFVKIFNFVEKAHAVRICFANNSPEAFQIKLGVGDNKGFIGYDKDKGNYVPKTTRRRSVNSIGRSEYKVNFIVSAPQNQMEYNKFEYESKKGLFNEERSKIPSRYKISI